MSVLDASVFVDALVVADDRGHAARARIAGEEVLHVPHLVDVEVANALRRLLQRGGVAPAVARQARASFADLPLERYPFAPFERRVWELRTEITPYDAWYVALAEELETELVTADSPLRGASSPRCPLVAP